MLARQQQEFIDALTTRDPAHAAALEFIAGGALTPEERLGIYRNNLRENFIKLMELEYPVIARLVGADFFRQTAREYLYATPSTSGDLFHAGRGFPAYLSREFAGGDYAYLPDVAALEWAYQEAMVAPDDDAVFDVAGLAALDAERYESLQLVTHPALRIVRSPYPIVTIWAANQPESTGDESIDLGRGGENALLLRPLRSTGIQAIPAGHAACLRALARGQALGEALSAALTEQPEFDLQPALAGWIQQRALVGWTLRQ